MKRGHALKTNSYNSKKQRLGFTRAPEYPVILVEEATSLLESACHSMNKALTFLHVFDVCKLMCCSTSTLRFCTSAFANERIWKQYLTTLLDPWGSYVSISPEVLVLFFFSNWSCGWVGMCYSHALHLFSIAITSLGTTPHTKYPSLSPPAGSSPFAFLPFSYFLICTLLFFFLGA